MAKLIHHRHSGRLQPHHRTSYVHLSIMLAIVGALISFVSPEARAAVDPSLIPAGFENPKNGSVGVVASVHGPAPKEAATILTPRNGSNVHESPLTVTGLCLAGTFVSLFDNGVFDGEVPCDDNGKFSLLADVFPGQNKLIAKISDILGQYGPDSAVVNVVYTPTELAGTTFSTVDPLFLTVDQMIFGGFPGDKISFRVSSQGGKTPYAVSWDFDDGTTIAVPQNSEGYSTVSHVYSRAGTYRVLVRVVDSNNNTAVLQLVAIVNGAINGYSNTTSKKLDIPGIALGIWPLYFLAILLVLIFWLGERREIYVLRRRMRRAQGVSSLDTITA